MLSTTSSTTIAEDKAALRRQVCLTLECLSPEAVRRGDDALFAAFSALPQVEAASTLFAFWGIPGREPDTGRLIRALTARGKRVGLVDDSIVRGTTSRQIVQLLREAGATQVHFLSSAPEFLYPCYFGVDVDSRENLIAANHTLEEMTGMLGVDSLGFLSVEGVKKIAEGCTCGLCTGCFTGHYPVPAPNETMDIVYDKPLSQSQTKKRL